MRLEDRLPPNGVAFSCRKRAVQDHVQKSDDLAREAVSCNAVFGVPWFMRLVQEERYSVLRGCRSGRVRIGSEKNALGDLVENLPSLLCADHRRPLVTILTSIVPDTCQSWHL